MLALICLLSCFAVLYASLSSTVPDNLAQYAGNSFEKTTLRVAIFKNKTRGVRRVARNTFKEIDTRGRIRYKDMLKFINDTQTELYSEISKDGGSITVAPNSVIEEAAAIQMTIIGGESKIIAISFMFRKCLDKQEAVRAICFGYSGH